MKKLFALLLSVLMALAIVSVSFAEEAPLIGILAPATTHGWVGGVAYYAQKAADDLGLNYKFVTSSNADEMSSQIEEMISLGAEAIVVWPQFTGVEVAAEMALEQDIVIYNFDMIINVDEKYADNIYQLTGDNYGMGVEGARYIAEKLGGEGNVVILDVPTSGNVAADRKAGFLDTIAAEAPGIEVLQTIDTQFTRDDGLKDMTDVLTAHGDAIDAVFSMDDETSIGALQAIKESGNTSVKVITGGGGCQEYFNMMLDEAYQDIWVASATYSPSMIVNCIENVLKVLEGEAMEGLVVIPTTIVDKDSAADFLDENSPY